MSQPKPCLCGCGEPLPAKANRGTPKKFINDNHRRAFWTKSTKQAAATLTKKATREQRATSPERRSVVLDTIPVEERAGLLRQAAINLGITDEGPWLKRLRGVV